MPDWVEQMEKDLGKAAAWTDEFLWILRNTKPRYGTLTPDTTRLLEAFVRTVEGRLEELQERRRPVASTLEDGYGNAWSKQCPVCDQLSMEIVRPGSVQCGNPECPQWRDEER